jgi:lon-related putative ATP-dependent protease
MTDRDQAEPWAARALPTDSLYRPCDPDQFPFASTADLEPLDAGLGQDRAAQAVRFALGMRHGGYNLFALGPAGTGKSDFVKGAVERAAARWPVPPDWCYVNNFDQPHKPRAVGLPAGRGRAFQGEMQQLIEELQTALPAAFESDEYRTRRSAIQEHFKERQEEGFGRLQEEAKERDLALIKTPMGLALAPIKDGEVLSPQEFEQLSASEKERRQAGSEVVQKDLEAFLHQIPKWEKEQREQLRQLNREVTDYAVGHLIDEIKGRWGDFAQVLEHLDAVRLDVIDNVDDFLPKEQQQPQLVIGPLGRPQGGAAATFRRYQVNVVVEQEARGEGDGAGGAPVVYEDHPTLPNLVGRIEHIAQFGTLVTDFTLIKPGALHRANGGCLILDARRVLLSPFAYETLKRSLRSGRIRIESAAESLGWASTTTLEPEPLPLDVKVVLIGEPILYYLLSAYDPEFPELFRVAADFETRIERNGENGRLYARFLAAIVRRTGIRPISREGVGRAVEHAARLSGDADRLSTHQDTIEDLLREADFWAGEKGQALIGPDHIQDAIDARTFRSDRIRERLQDEIARGTVVIETEGARVGQVNGLAVLQLDRFAFGKPSRITARVRLGKGDVVDIEREVALGGPLHSKGVLILASYLSARYAGDRPLSLSASLVFEQSYGGVEGDSASSAELYALLSALSGIPIRQSLAVTGSVDQLGRVQAIGGVNEKIEGFFDVCAARGLKGDQGVLIPAANVRHLMLRRDVVEACGHGLFHVYAVASIDEGIAILTGVPAGEADGSGSYPIGTVNRAVANRLAAFTRSAIRLSAAAETAKEAARKTRSKEGAR